MPFWKIAWRNIQQRALASSLTALSMALGVAVMIAVIVIHGVTVRQFGQDAQGYHLIVGGKGGALQLVLSTVFHLGRAPYPIPYTYYQKFIDDGEYADSTAVAVPQCLGDSYQAPDGATFRVVGTTPDMFDKLHYGNNNDGTPKIYRFQKGGRNFESEHFFEAVVGSVVARKAGLTVGDEIQPTHDVSPEGHKHDAFELVGILEPTGTANDRAVFINIEGFYLLEGHARSESGDKTETPTVEHHDEDHEEAEKHDDHSKEDKTKEDKGDQAHGEHGHDHGHSHAHDHKPLPIEQREVTSILVLCKNFGELKLERAINKEVNGVAQAVAPAREVTVLLDKIVGPVRTILLVLTVLIVIVAGVSILVSIYNSMSERSHDIAVMRSLGASRDAVMAIVLVESILLSVGGGLIGVLLGHGMIGLVSPYVAAETGVTLNMWNFDWQELLLIPGLVVLASLVGYLPALAAYRTDVAKTLAGGR